MDDDITIRPHHAQALRFCKKGTKKFVEDNGLDWATFIKHGYPASIVIATNDYRALKVVELARKGQ